MANGKTTQQKGSNSINENNCENVSHEIDGYWGWIIVLASFCIHIITDGITYSFGEVYIQLLDEFKEGKSYTSWIMSLMTGITLCSGPISSHLVNKYGCRVVTIAGSILAAFCLLISVYAQHVLTLIITIGVGVGFGLGLIYLPAIVSVSMYFNKYRSLATGIAVAGSGLGTSIFAPLIAFIAETYGWRKSLFILSGIVLICALFGALFRSPAKPQRPTPTNPSQHIDAYQCDDVSVMEPTLDDFSLRETQKNGASDTLATTSVHKHEQYERKPLLDDHKSNSNRTHSQHRFYHGSLRNIFNGKSSNESVAPENSSIQTIEEEELPSNEMSRTDSLTNVAERTNRLRLLKDPVFMLYAVSNVCTVLGFYIPYFYLPDRAKELSISEKDVGSMLATIGIANTIGRIVLGYISDSSYRRRLSVYRICLFTCGLATASSVLCTDLESLTIYAAVFGFTIGAYVGLTSVILVDLMGLHNLTDAFGLLLLFQGISSFIGPPIVGAMYDEFKTYTYGFQFAGAMIALSSILVFFIPTLQNYVAYKQLQCEYEPFPQTPLIQNI